MIYLEQIKPSDLDVLQADVVKTSKPKCPYCRTRLFPNYDRIDFETLISLPRMDKQTNFDDQNFKIQCPNCNSLYILKAFFNPVFTTVGLKKSESAEKISSQEINQKEIL